jgi:hypothetical protein
MAFSKVSPGAAAAGAGRSVRFVDSLMCVATADLDSAICARFAAALDCFLRALVRVPFSRSRFFPVAVSIPAQIRASSRRAGSHVFQAQVLDP